MSRTLIALALMLLPIAAVPLIGTGAILLAVVLPLAFLALGGFPGRRWPPRIAAALALAGAGIGVSSATAAFLAVGGDPAYQSRLAFGSAALILAALAGAAGLLAATRPSLSALGILLGGFLGAVAINLYYINTFYLLAVPLWVLAAALAAFGGLRPDPGPRRP
jgi:hypothetical protein